MKKKSGILSTIILVIFFLGVLGACVYFAMYMTNGGTTDIRMYDIVNENNEIIDNVPVCLKDDKTPVKFKVVSKFDNVKIPNVIVRAVPNENANNVSVVVSNTDLRKLTNCKDFTAMFDIDIKDNVITVSTDWDIQKYLAEYNVVDVSEIEIREFKNNIVSYIDLQFIIGDLKIKCNLIDYVTVKSVEIDNDNVLIEG